MDSYWVVTNKGDQECRELADRHYSRQTPGHPLFTRPGYNMVLKYREGRKLAVWVWFRPKWESGIKGTERKDGLRAIECALFRNETAVLSSDLITAACVVLKSWERAWDVDWLDGAITGINIGKTDARRSKFALPGFCYRVAGWEEFEHNKSRSADLWLRYRREWFDELWKPRWNWDGEID